MTTYHQYDRNVRIIIAAVLLMAWVTIMTGIIVLGY